MHILINNDGKRDFQFETEGEPEVDDILRLLPARSSTFPTGIYEVLSVSKKLGGLSGVFSFEISIKKISDHIYEPVIRPNPPLIYVSAYK